MVKRLMASMAMMGALAFAVTPTLAHNATPPAAVVSGAGNMNCAISGVLIAFGVFTLDPVVAAIGVLAATQACQ